MTGLRTLAFSQPASRGSHLECISINRCALLGSFVKFLSFLICLSQSVVLWQSMGGIQKIATFGKRSCHFMTRTAQISKEKWQSIITLRHGETIICSTTGQLTNTTPGCVKAISPRKRVMECCIRWPGLHNHPASTQLRWFGMSWKKVCFSQCERKAANKCSAYAGIPSRRWEKHSRWSCLRECQEFAKLSSRQRVATLTKFS